MIVRNRIVSLLMFALTIFGAMLITSGQGVAQQCVTCASGCGETTVSYEYDNLFCSCPTGSHCVSSGGVCTTCQGAGPAYCYDTLNGCGGLFNNSTSSACGCGDPCRA